MNRQYTRIQAKWQVPLEKKKLKREKRLANPIEPKEPNEEKLVVHNEEEGIEYPCNPQNMFAVVRIKGTQHKVMKDDRIICEKLPFEVGAQVEFDDVLLLGTADYTAVGRPNVEKASVLATVEEISLSEKVLIFKKKRRQGY